MTILWQLNSKKNCLLKWGLDQTYSTGNYVSTGFGNEYQHQYTISSLTPSTKYYYSIQIDDYETTGSFVAAPSDSATNVKFFAYGDSRTYPETHNLVDEQILNEINDDPDYQSIVLHVGDIVTYGTSESSWTNDCFDLDSPNSLLLRSITPTTYCIGNHDLPGTLFTKYWPYPYEDDHYWSFDYGPAHILVIDQYTTYSTDSTQYNFIDQDLAVTDKEWKVVMYHEPGWSSHRGENENVIQYLQPLLEQYNVDIVFNGHDHFYERHQINGIVHLTTGGAGAPLYSPEYDYPYAIKAFELNHFCKIEINDQAMTVTVINIDGYVIDKFYITHGDASAGMGIDWKKYD